MVVNTKDRAAFQGTINESMQEVLASLRKKLEEEKKLREEFGDEAVEAHLQQMGKKPIVRYASEEKRPNP
jgi:hypothetical protein